MADLKPSDLLFGVSRYVAARHFSRALALLGLDEVQYTPVSLRPGGCTDHFQRFRNLGELQFLGRWKQASTLQFYLHEAYAVHVTRQGSERCRHLLRETHGHVHMLEKPPVRSLCSLIHRK